MRLFRAVVSIFTLAVCVGVFGQSAGKPIASSDGQAALDLMKTLVGTWRGSISTDNPAWSTDKPMPLSIRVASHGNALLHELDTGGPEITVFYLENGRLAVMHYCDFGNRPHLVARPENDGKTIEFDLVELSGSDQIGHVSHGVFTIIDSNHHVEDWIFIPAGSKPVHAHMDFMRVP